MSTLPAQPLDAYQDPAQPVDPTEPQPAAPPGDGADAATIAALVLIFGAGLSAGATEDAVEHELERHRIDRRAARAAYRLARAGLTPLPPSGAGRALTGAARANWTYTAAYLLAAGKRLTKALLQGDLKAGIARERVYLKGHDFAQRNRLRAAREVDAAARRHGPLLGWYSQQDAATTAECLAAHRNNFYAAVRPLIGWPGSVHSRCRCVPVRPWPGGALLP